MNKSYECCQWIAAKTKAKTKASDSALITFAYLNTAKTTDWGIETK